MGDTGPTEPVLSLWLPFSLLRGQYQALRLELLKSMLESAEGDQGFSQLNQLFPKSGTAVEGFQLAASKIQKTLAYGEHPIGLCGLPAWCTIQIKHVTKLGILIPKFQRCPRNVILKIHSRASHLVSTVL